MFMKKSIIILILVIIFVISVNIFKKTIHPFTYSTIQPMEGNMKLTTVFAYNESIPSKYTCDGEDAAPELTISEVPADSKSLVLIVDDPDAPIGTWVHWLVYNIPVSTAKIDAKNLPQDAKQGMTDFGRVGWGGPCPPSGTHRYFFKLYAIDKVLDLPDGATKTQLEQAIKDHIVEKTELIGLYKRIK